MRALHWTDRVLTAALDAVVILLALLLLVLLNWAVFARFVLNDSVSWGEELPAHLLAMLAFLGAAYLTRTNEHIGFDGLVRLFSPQVQRAVFALNLAAMAMFGAVIAYYGTIAALSFSGRALISIDLPMALFRASMPVGCALIALICTVRLIGLLTGKIDPGDLLPETDA